MQGVQFCKLRIVIDLRRGGGGRHVGDDCFQRLFYAVELQQGGKRTGEQEEAANKFAQDSLIPSDQYKKFVEGAKFDLQSIKEFANRINRDPGIVLGRLQNDKIVDFNDWILRPLRHKYKVRTMI